MDQANQERGGLSGRQLRLLTVLMLASAMGCWVVWRAADDAAPGDSMADVDVPAIEVSPDFPGAQPDLVPINPNVSPPVATNGSQPDESGPELEIVGREFSELLDHADSALAAGELVGKSGALSLYEAAVAVGGDQVDEAEDGLETARVALIARLDRAIAEQTPSELEPLLAAAEQFIDDPSRWQSRQERARPIMIADQLLTSIRGRQRSTEPVSTADVEELVQARELAPELVQRDGIVNDLVARIVASATAVANKDDFQKAFEWIDKGLVIQPTSGALESLRDSLQWQYRSRQDALLSAATTAIADLDEVGALEAIEQLERLGIQTDWLRADLDRSRIYGQFDHGMLFRDPIGPDRYGPEMVVLPVGEFRMGGVQRENTPVHRVRFATSFAMARTEITVAQYRQFVNHSGYISTAENAGFGYVYDGPTGRVVRRRGVSWQLDYLGDEADDELPVIHVSFEDAQAYARWLRTRTGADYRLPSEAQYEYALRSGGSERFWWGDGDPVEVLENLTGSEDRFGRGRRWNASIAGYDDGHWGPAPVASFFENPYQLFDLAGNVTEWVEDCWHDNYRRAPGDGSAWVNRGCSRRTVRGGYWGGDPATARSAWRSSHSPTFNGPNVGFRVVRNLRFNGS